MRSRLVENVDVANETVETDLNAHRNKYTNKIKKRNSSTKDSNSFLNQSCLANVDTNKEY